MQLHRQPVSLNDDEMAFVQAQALLRATHRRSFELHRRGLRARYAVARELGTHLIVPCPPATSPVDMWHRGWAIKVKSCSVSVSDPALWFRRREGHSWDGAVLVAHHPAHDDTVWICGWLGRLDWEERAALREMYSKRMWVVEEGALQDFYALLRVRERWESL